MDVSCEDCKRWVPMSDDTDSGWCGIQHKPTEPDETCPAAVPRYYRKDFPPNDAKSESLS